MLQKNRYDSEAHEMFMLAIIIKYQMGGNNR